VKDTDTHLSILAHALGQACKLTGVGKEQLLLILTDAYDRPPEREPLQRGVRAGSLSSCASSVRQNSRTVSSRTYQEHCAYGQDARTPLRLT
jgi:hypothetical protein